MNSTTPKVLKIPSRQVINCYDIQSVINEFITDFKTILAWRHSCSVNLYMKYNVAIDNKKMKILRHKKKIHEIFKIIEIDIPSFFDDSYIINFQYLRKLDCSLNRYITDNSICNLFNLTELICNDNITDKSLKCLMNIKKLQVNDNITNESLNKLLNLEILLLTEHCDINDFTLPKLKRLHCGFNKKCSITNEINKIITLEVLHAVDNQYITEISLPNLKILYCNTLVRKLLCQNLTHLYCSENEILNDDVLINLPNLIYLDCGYNNNFTDYSLKRLKNLTFLDCSFCTKFTDDGLKHLCKLTKLYCSYNINFTNYVLPYLTKLTFLNCGSNNNFTARGILNLTNLEELVCRYGRSNVDISDLKPLNKLKKINGIAFPHRYSNVKKCNVM